MACQLEVRLQQDPKNTVFSFNEAFHLPRYTGLGGLSNMEKGSPANRLWGRRGLRGRGSVYQAAFTSISLVRVKLKVLTLAKDEKSFSYFPR